MHPTLPEWMEKNRLFSAFGPKQTQFVQDELATALYGNHAERDRFPVRVVGTHRIKGIDQPVYEIMLADGTVLTLRNDHRDWKVSVRSACDIGADFMDLFDPESEQDTDDCGGFPPDRIYGSYAKNRRRFTVGIRSDALLFTFAFILGHALGLRRPPEDADRTFETQNTSR